MNGWIGVDFDGTIAEYHGWEGEFVFGEPIWTMVARVKYWIQQGYQVKIFTARISDPESREHMIFSIQEWLTKKAGLPKLEVTNEKDYGMLELWDDRAVQVEMNTGQPVGYSTRGL